MILYFGFALVGILAVALILIPAAVLRVMLSCQLKKTGWFLSEDSMSYVKDRLRSLELDSSTHRHQNPGHMLLIRISGAAMLAFAVVGVVVMFLGG